jgi:hypothetical protein
MTRLGWRIATLVACAALAPTAQAQVPSKPPESSAPKDLSQRQRVGMVRLAESPAPKELSVSPAPAPVPALEYRLLPISSELNPGDAAPIYLRIRYEMQEEDWKEINEAPVKLLQLPLDRLPISEARKTVNRATARLELIEFGAHRKTCDWNYTLPEQRLERIAILLPDVQAMRGWGRMVALKARIEIAERNYGAAIRTLETGLALARHVAGGPFYINGLVGVAIAHSLLYCCEEFVAQPGAPNLYWALTALPRPLISFRDAHETEMRLAESMMPELTELDRPRTGEEWHGLLKRMHEHFVRWCRLSLADGDDTPIVKGLAGWDFARFRSESLPSAREHLKTARRLSDSQLRAMSEDQVVALYIGGRYRELRDDLFKGAYLRARDARPLFSAAEKRLIAAKSGPIALFVLMQPAVQSVMWAELNLDRRIAALRVIEAIRMYAAAHDGSLPDALGQVTEIPVPEDPATGTPFEYRRDGAAALLSGPRAEMPFPRPSYRITIRR